MTTLISYEVYHEDLEAPITVHQFPEAPSYGVVVSTGADQSDWPEVELVMLPEMAERLGKALVAVARHCQGMTDE